MSYEYSWDGLLTRADLTQGRGRRPKRVVRVSNQYLGTNYKE